MTMTALARVSEAQHAQLPIPNPCDLPVPPALACRAIQEGASRLGESALDSMAEQFITGFGDSLRLALGWWVEFPSPELSSNGMNAVLSQIRGYTSGLQVLFLTAGVLFAGARLALAKRGGVAGEAQEALLMLGRAVFGAMAFAAVITAGTRAGDEFATWVLFDAARGDVYSLIVEITALDAYGLVDLGPGLLVVIGLLGVISMLIQLVMLVVRQALLLVVVAVIPIAAAASGTGPGSQAYKRLVAWSLAFTLWKPVGALIYAVAFTIAGHDHDDPQLVLLGLILLVLSVVALPALIRLIAPAVAALGSGGGASSVLAGGAAGVAMSAIGNRSSARKVGEGDNAASAPREQGAASGLSGSSSGGRPMPEGGGSSSKPADARAGQVGPSPSRGSSSVGASKRSTSGGGAASRASTGSGAAAAAMVAKAGVDLAKEGSSALDRQVESSVPPDPDALGPGVVRR